MQVESSGIYLRHSNMSLGSGRATICGGGSCNPAQSHQRSPQTRVNRRRIEIEIEANRAGERRAHLAERVVLLLEALEAALVGHGKNPRRARRDRTP